jgi:hypothetical protein
MILPPVARAPQAVIATCHDHVRALVLWLLECSSTSEHRRCFPVWRGAVFPSRPDNSQAAGAVAVKDGLALPRPPRACAARSVLEGGDARWQPRHGRAASFGPKYNPSGFPRCFLHPIIIPKLRSGPETPFRHEPRTRPGQMSAAGLPQNPPAPDKPAPNATAAGCKPSR